jgi:UDP-N-acetylmuramate--alanine ligase
VKLKKEIKMSNLFSSIKKIHFVGIGGIGMSGIAEILVNQGFSVSGSDLNISDNTKYLENLGVEVFYGHRKENIQDSEVVVYSSAVKINENPETSFAIENKIPLIRRAEMLAEVSRLKYCLAVAGTHGKTTTTSMVSLALINAGIDPTVVVGGRLRDFGGTNARLGKGDWTIVEADEYDRSFLQLLPTIAIINNIEAEHLDIYSDFDDIKSTFLEFANKVPFYGFIALGLDDGGVREIMGKLNKKVRTFGFSKHSDVRPINVEYDKYATNCEVIIDNENVGKLSLNVPGMHNLKNALAAITVANGLGVNFEIIAKSLKDFKGVYRRFELKGNYIKNDGQEINALVFDDYAHHPSEVKATLQAAKNGWNSRIIGVFQPHTFTRTKEHYKEFAQSFDDADIIIITDVYGAREEPIEGINGKLISDATTKYGHKNVVYIPSIEDVKIYLENIVKNDDVILTMGAGSIWKLSESLVK